MKIVVFLRISIYLLAVGSLSAWNMASKKKIQRGRQPKIKIEKQLDLFMRRKSDLIVNAVLKERTDNIFDEMVREIGMTPSATYFAVLKNI